MSTTSSAPKLDAMAARLPKRRSTQARISLAAAPRRRSAALVITSAGRSGEGSEDMGRLGWKRKGPTGEVGPGRRRVGAWAQDPFDGTGTARRQHARHEHPCSVQAALLVGFWFMGSPGGESENGPTP